VAKGDRVACQPIKDVSAIAAQNPPLFALYLVKPAEISSALSRVLPNSVYLRDLTPIFTTYELRRACTRVAGRVIVVVKHRLTPKGDHPSNAPGPVVKLQDLKRYRTWPFR